jgi:hypothetical protein
MRVVYGAGAVAAMSAMAVGLVKPDFNATVAGLVSPAAQSADAADALSLDAGYNGAPRDRQRIVRYVYLQPGESAPRNARVITAAEAARRLGTDDDRQPDRQARQPSQPNRQPRQPRPEQEAPDPQPPAPPVRTRQSGG